MFSIIIVSATVPGARFYWYLLPFQMTNAARNGRCVADDDDDDEKVDGEGAYPKRVYNINHKHSLRTQRRGSRTWCGDNSID